MDQVDRGVRVNVTLPPAVHQVVQQYAVATGQTMAGAVTDLLRHVGVSYARRWLAGDVLADVIEGRKPSVPGSRQPRQAAPGAESAQVPSLARSTLAPVPRPLSLGPGERIDVPDSRPLSRAERRRAERQKSK